MHSKPVRLAMKDGTPYAVQPCVEQGTAHTAEFLKTQIASALGKLSVQSRWQRFASPMARLTDAQLDYLTRLDGKDRVAWCAAVERDGDEHGIGLARYVRLADEPAVAEFAVTVVDEFQAQGVGYALLTKLQETARDNGLTSLRGYVLPSNRRMLALCRRLGADISTPDSGFVTVEIALNGPPDPPIESA